MPRPLHRKFLALLAGALGALLAAELAVRLFVGAPLAERLPLLRILPHPTRGWRMVPNEVHYTYRHRVETNRLGLRGKELLPKRPGVRRVLALGDSLTYGQGVADDATLPAWLERILNEDEREGRAWEVVNAGHRAYDTRQEVALARELAPEIRPDEVILFFYRDDLAPRDIGAIHARLSAHGGPIVFDVGTPFDGRWERFRWHARQVLRRSALLMYVHDRLAKPPARPHSDAFLELARERLDRELDALLELGERVGFRTWFVLLPHRQRIVDRDAPGRLTLMAAELARRKGLEVIEVLPDLQRQYARNFRLMVLPFDGHYDTEGNRFIARVVARRMLGLQR